jgi:hypothetical protein
MKMRKIVLTALITSLVAASTLQMATAAEHHVQKARRDNFLGAYNQLNTSSLAERNLENFGFSGKDPSRVGGFDPDLRPSGS